MRHRQRDYVKTNIGQLVVEVIVLAKRYGADVSIERLSRFRPKGRRFNKKVMTIPFSLFRRILEGRCFDSGIMLNRVDAYHTSKWCSHCGAVGNGHDGGNYSLFRCKECGQVVNSDRKASLAVAVKTLLERNGLDGHTKFQVSGRRVPVSGLIRGVSDAPGVFGSAGAALGRGKAPILIGGSLLVRERAAAYILHAVGAMSRRFARSAFLRCAVAVSTVDDEDRCPRHEPSRS